MLKKRHIKKVALGKINSLDNANDYKIFFNNYFFRLVNFSIYFVKTHENAEDVVEEVFYKFLKNKTNIHKIQNIDSYLFRMTKNESLNFLKKNKFAFQLQRIENAEDYHIQVESTPQEKLEGDEFEKMVNKLIDSFPPKRKTIFRLSREEHLSYLEIAELLEISVKTVESHMTIALKNIREFIMEYDEGLDTKMRKIAR